MIEYAKLKLYYNTTALPFILEKDKNFIIDDIETYLSSFTPIVINDFQYAKNALNLDIVVDLSQSYSQPLEENGIRYISIQNHATGRIYYYFVDKCEWRANKAVKLYLTMDTLNTNRYDEDYTLTDKTLIIRQHKDRFSSYEQHEKRHYEVNGDETLTLIVEVDTNKKVDETSIEFVFDPQDIHDIESSITEEGNIELTINFQSGAQICEFDIEWDYKCLRREIDIRNEGLSPTLYKETEDYINDNTGIDWLLLYKNRNQITPTDFNQVNPVDCYLIPKEDITIKLIAPIISNQQIGLNGISIYPFDSAYLTIKMDNKVIKLKQINGFYVGKQYIELRLNGAQQEYRIVTTHMTTTSGGANVYYADYGSWKAVTTITLADGTFTLGVYSGYPQPSYVYYSNIWRPTKTLTFTIPNVTHTITGDNIDRTDSKNIKYIALPYSPTTIEKEGDIFVLSSEWSWSDSESNILLFDIKTDFSNSFTWDSKVFADLYLPETTINPNTTRNAKYESKLYNSTYYRNKFVYDSFSKVFELENMRDVEDTTKLDIGFIASKNMTSKFLFTFPQYNLKRALEDYPNVVLVGRNNEELLYNSAYINYLRNGYNYDMRSKERTQVAGGASLGAQAITSAAAIIGGIATNNPIGVVAGIGMGVSFVTSLISYAKTTIDNEESINRKLDEAKRQAVSVSAVDDIDLLRAYSNNKAKICYYRMNEEVKKAIYDIFFYCGYTCNYQAKPNITSRCWFNFLQAEAEIENHKNLSEEIINDLKEKFKNGVTFFHKYNGSYNIERNLENVETSILGGNE